MDVTQENAREAVEEDEEGEESQGLVKSVLQAKLQRLAILIGYFGTLLAVLAV